MTQWAAFVGFSGVVLCLLLGLSYLTQQAFDADDLTVQSDSQPASSERDPDSALGSEGDASGTDSPEQSEHTGERAVEPPQQGAVGEDEEPTGGAVETAPQQERLDPQQPPEPSSSDGPTARQTSAEPQSLSTGALLANVAFSQGLFAALLVGAALWAAIPLDALGIEVSWSYVTTGLVVGSLAGLVLYILNEVGAALAKRYGIDHDEALRRMLAPESPGGWVVLLGGVLPIIAFFEELLFRAALIGVVAAGFEINIWLLAILSSIAFGIGHGMQGTAGIVVTGLLGFVLATLFILTGSLLVVVVAHYVINALEFIVHEGLDIAWLESPQETITES